MPDLPPPYCEDIAMLRQKSLAALLVATLIGGTAVTAQAADKYTFDPGHSQINFSWNHFGFSNIWARFDKFDGELLLDTQDLTRSSVSVTIPLSAIDTDVEKLDEHLKSADFFDAAKFPNITFKSTKVEKAGEGKLKVTGDLSIHGVTKATVLDVTVNKIGQHPMMKDDAAGFDASATIKRSEFGVGMYAPNVSDEIAVRITAETHKAK
ncbi:MAG: YceI family protein [Lysobacterales bacterium]